jgi:hypothetical protein
MIHILNSLYESLIKGKLLAFVDDGALECLVESHESVPAIFDWGWFFESAVVHFIYFSFML